MTILNTILPLPVDDLKQAIINPDIAVTIDYGKSSLKARMALVYLTNANLPSVRFDTSSAARQDVYELIDSYITHKSTFNNPSLVTSVMQVVYAARGIMPPHDDQASIDELSLVSRDEIDDYVADQARAINLLKLIHVLDSLPVSVMASHAAFEETIECDPSITVISDIDYTGFTWINLIQIDSFVTTYLTHPPLTQPSFFKQQFEEYIYNGSNLYPYLAGTFLVALVNELLSGGMTVKQLGDAVDELNSLVD